MEMGVSDGKTWMCLVDCV